MFCKTILPIIFIEEIKLIFRKRYFRNIHILYPHHR